MFGGRKFLSTILLLLLLALGIGASHWNADRLEKSAQKDWLNTAGKDAAHMTELVISSASKLEVNLRALSSYFLTMDTVNQSRFEDIIAGSEDWDSNVTFDNVAFLNVLYGTLN